MYDRSGDRGLVENSVDLIDPSTLFATVFGSDKVFHFIGEIHLSSLTKDGDKSGTTASKVAMKQVQSVSVGNLF